MSVSEGGGSPPRERGERSVKKLKLCVELSTSFHLTVKFHHSTEKYQVYYTNVDSVLLKVRKEGDERRELRGKYFVFVKREPKLNNPQLLTALYTLAVVSSSKTNEELVSEFVEVIGEMKSFEKKRISDYTEEELRKLRRLLKLAEALGVSKHELNLKTVIFLVPTNSGDAVEVFNVQDILDLWEGRRNG